MADNDEDDFATQSPPVAIIDDDELFNEPMLNFPYHDSGETLLYAARKVARYIQWGMFSPYILPHIY